MSGRAPVLFLHSLAGGAGQWKAQIEHLMPERLALAVDLPGHGVSDLPEGGDFSPPALAAEVGSVVDALGLSPVVLVGHSFGASVAIALVAERSRAIAGLLLVDPAPDIRGEAADEIERFLANLRADYEPAIVAHYESALLGARSEVRTSVLEMLGAAHPETVIGALASLPAFDPVTPLAAYGGVMRAVIAEQHDGPAALHAVVDGLDVRRLAGVSHWLHMDRPDEFNAILDEFLAAVDSNSAAGSER